MSVAETIEGIFVAHMGNVASLTTVLAQEPDTVDRKQCPLLSMFFLLPQGDVVETGLGEDVDYSWEINLYVTLDKWPSAQVKMREVSQDIVANFRQHRVDYDSYPDFDLRAVSLLRNAPPSQLEDASGILRASWILRVSATEV